MSWTLRCFPALEYLYFLLLKLTLKSSSVLDLTRNSSRMWFVTVCIAQTLWVSVQYVTLMLLLGVYIGLPLFLLFLLTGACSRVSGWGLLLGLWLLDIWLLGIWLLGIWLLGISIIPASTISSISSLWNSLKRREGGKKGRKKGGKEGRKQCQLEGQD